MKKITAILLFVLLSGTAVAESVVIVHPSNANAIDASAISKLFLGKSQKFSSGDEAVPVNIESGSVRESFDQAVLGKSEAQLKAYWAKLVFTGKGSPPKEVASDAEVKALIAANPNMIGYISSASADDSVKVVLTF